VQDDFDRKLEELKELNKKTTKRIVFLLFFLWGILLGVHLVGAFLVSDWPQDTDDSMGLFFGVLVGLGVIGVLFVVLDHLKKFFKTLGM